MGSLMVKVGSFCALAGLLSTVLYFIGYNLRILMWVDALGPSAAWAVRLGMVVGGAIVLVAGRAMEPTEA